jgi:hypothetical protein
MPSTFTTTGGTAHTTTVTGLADGEDYSFFVRCQDPVGNANPNDFTISFSVAQAADTTPPVRSNGAPTGTLTAGTIQTTLSLTTDENAVCRYATTAGVAYASMPSTFATTGGTAHTTSVSGLTNGGTYSFFVRCQDPVGNANTNDFAISFSVGQPADTTPPVRSSGAPTGTLAAGTTQTTLSLATNENASCRYATTAGVAYASMPSAFATTGGAAHSTTVSGLTNGGSYSFFVRCQDPAGNANLNDFTISFSVAQSTTPPDSLTYNAAADFSSTQGFRNWFYLYGAGTPMTFSSDVWGGNEAHLSLWADGGHPGNVSDAIRRWVAPQAGSIRITGTAADLHTICGAGVVVYIRRNATILWQQTIVNGNTVGIAFDLTTPVLAGDNIDFGINRGPDNVWDCDYTSFDPTIVLTPS